MCVLAHAATVRSGNPPSQILPTPLELASVNVEAHLSGTDMLNISVPLRCASMFTLASSINRVNENSLRVARRVHLFHCFTRTNAQARRSQLYRLALQGLDSQRVTYYIMVTVNPRHVTQRTRFTTVTVGWCYFDKPLDRGCVYI